MAFYPVASAAELGENKATLVQVSGKAILVCRSDGQIFAIENRCTHDNEQLVGGRIQKCSIVCPFHGARFSLKNGAPYGPPAFEALTTYPVRVIEGVIEVEVAS